ncbi:MAG: HD domain-containing protein [bacterium]|nr:HD domain-containing protein [bacterium]
MRKIVDIYEEYKILPNLQMHQLRVASVAMQICDSLDIELNKNNISIACLLHDMGNIIKFNLHYFPEFLKPKGLEYWQNVQNEYVGKYGKDEHRAVQNIAKELGVSEDVSGILNSIGFSKAKENLNSDNISNKIASYADMRVGPTGVFLLESRLSDLRERYQKKKSLNHASSLNIGIHPTENNVRRIFEDSLRKIEQQIFMNSKIKPEDITDESIKPYMEKLEDFEI